MNTTLFSVARQCMVCLVVFFAVAVAAWGQASEQPIYYIDYSETEGYWKTPSDKALYEELLKTRLGPRLQQMKKKTYFEIPENASSRSGICIHSQFLLGAASILLTKNGMYWNKYLLFNSSSNFEQRSELDATIKIRDFILSWIN